jgi:predicted DNA-binding transcriptional regulator AlpA
VLKQKWYYNKISPNMTKFPKAKKTKNPFPFHPKEELSKILVEKQ